MSEITMLSKMVRAGLLCNFKKDETGICLEVSQPAFTKKTYSCEAERGTSALIALAWVDWRGYCEGEDL